MVEYGKAVDFRLLANMAVSQVFAEIGKCGHIRPYILDAKHVVKQEVGILLRSLVLHERSFKHLRC